MIPNHRWLEHLVRHLPVAREGQDPEGVHQIRAAARRLDVWLAMGGWSVLRPDLRWFRQRASAVRDLDVLLMHEPPPPEGWRADLEQRREHARTDLLAALDHPRTAGMVAALAQMPALKRSRAERAIRRIAARARKCGRALEEANGDLDACHRLRRCLRKLRFALEWAEHKPKPLKALQLAFGELNDRAVALDYLQLYPGNGEVLQEYRLQLLDDLEQTRCTALETWQGHHDRLKDPLAW